VVSGVDATEIAVGGTLRIAGEGFAIGREGWVTLHFEGQFRAEGGGEAVPAAFEIEVFTTRPEVTWTDFGRHRVPFGDGYTLGTFEGTVRAVNHFWDGSESGAGTPLDLSLRIVPSFVIEELTAGDEGWVADCAEPAARLLQEVPYGLQVRALGFEATAIAWEIGPGLVVEGTPQETQTTGTAIPDADGRHAFRFALAPVPDWLDGYATHLEVRATDAAGVRRELRYDIRVVRPVDFRFGESFKVAQVYDAVPVSGTIPGGPSSVMTRHAVVSETPEPIVSLDVTERRGYAARHAEAHGRRARPAVRFESTAPVPLTDLWAEPAATTTSELSLSSAPRAEIEVSADESAWTIAGQSYASREPSIDRPRAITRGLWTSSRHVDLPDPCRTAAPELEARCRAAAWDRTLTYEVVNGVSMHEDLALVYDRAVTASADREEGWREREDAPPLETNAWVFATQCGAWYEQTTRVRRTGVEVMHDLCGNATEVGTVTLDRFTVSPALGRSDCTGVFPESPFDPARCVTPPCDP
jgi:hypothetical protein